jgi:hypothetical protein
VTGHPLAELGDASMDDEVANFFFEESWLMWYFGVSVIMVR